MPSLIGKEATVVKSDVSGKVKVSYDEHWCGYFFEDELQVVQAVDQQLNVCTLIQIIHISEQIGKYNGFLDLDEATLIKSSNPIAWKAKVKKLQEERKQLFKKLIVF